ncbi:MAG: hypothetical protein C0524_14080 [Rhodobacter sp.]|nr:hypothetical protein [Rhodobacter sp.]
MTDLPISHSQATNSAGRIAAVFATLIAQFRTACGALGQATMLHFRRRAMRRAPEEILMAQARREEARRAVDRLLQRR